MDESLSIGHLIDTPIFNSTICTQNCEKLLICDTVKFHLVFIYTKPASNPKVSKSSLNTNKTRD